MDLLESLQDAENRVSNIDDLEWIKSKIAEIVPPRPLSLQLINWSKDKDILAQAERLGFFKPKPGISSSSEFGLYKRYCERMRTLEEINEMADSSDIVIDIPAIVEKYNEATRNKILI